MAAKTVIIRDRATLPFASGAIRNRRVYDPADYAEKRRQPLLSVRR